MGISVGLSFVISTYWHWRVAGLDSRQRKLSHCQIYGHETLRGSYIKLSRQSYFEGFLSKREKVSPSGTQPHPPKHTRLVNKEVPGWLHLHNAAVCVIVSPRYISLLTAVLLARFGPIFSVFGWTMNVPLEMLILIDHPSMLETKTILLHMGCLEWENYKNFQRQGEIHQSYSWTHHFFGFILV